MKHKTLSSSCKFPRGMPAAAYPWNTQPAAGCFHAVEFGTVYFSNGSLPGGVTGVLLNLPVEFAVRRFANARAAKREEMQVFHDGSVRHTYHDGMIGTRSADGVLGTECVRF